MSEGASRQPEYLLTPEHIANAAFDALDEAVHEGFVLPVVAKKYFEEHPDDLKNALDTFEGATADPMVRYRIQKLRQDFGL